MSSTITPLPRTSKQIAAHLEAIKDDDMFGFRRDVLAPFVEYQDIRRWLKPEVTQKEWDDDRSIPTVEEAITQMRSYMAFAWEKALDERSLSASRSVEKMEAWCWLIGRDDLAEFAANPDNYPMYGIPILHHISMELGFQIPEEV